MRKLLISLLGVASIVDGASAQSQNAIRLKPSTPWLLDYAEDSCRLARTFGTGELQVTLFLDQFQPEAGFYVIIGGEPVRSKRDVIDVKLSFRFGPDEQAQDENAHTGTMGKQPALIVDSAQRIGALSEEEEAVRDAAIEAGNRYNLPDISTARAAAVKYLEIRGAPNDVVLETGPMNQPLGVLGECAWDTVEDWGLNVQQQKTLMRGPKAKGGSERWFGSADYPRNMIRGNYQGTVYYRLIVDETGKPKSCHVQRSTRPKEFDETVCRVVMRRAKFEPALDSTGKPVASFWSQAITFRLQG